MNPPPENTRPTPKAKWDGWQWVPYRWVSFDAHTTFTSLPALPWLPIPDDYSGEELNTFVKKVFRYAVELAEQERKSKDIKHDKQ